MMKLKPRVTTILCLRCGHEWHPHKPERPRRCAACGDPNYDKPRSFRRDGLKRGRERAKPESAA